MINEPLPQIQINVLGKFQLIRGETPVTRKEWSAAKKPQMLLKALITKGRENVLIDQLIDDLWPAASFDEGKQNFKTVLHRLRKILGHPAGSRSLYISFERNTVSLNRSMVRLDIDDFFYLCKRAGRAEQAGDLKSSINLGNSAIELYKGDYLEDELYTPWTMMKREETRALYINVLRRTASLYERQGNSRKAIEVFKLLIRADPGLEESYRKLMLLYSNIGMRAEAIRIYNECKRVLSRELDVDPDELTTSIYKRIVESGRHDGERKPLDLDRLRSYTPKNLVEKILTNRSSIEGERKNVTVMFADVANYESIFEKLDPEAVHEIMDGCFRVLLDEVHRFEGTVNQSLSNGVMALFGAPVAHEDHAQRACHAALAIQSAMALYAESLKSRYGVDFKMRIGLNSGLVVVGSIGNDLRMDYTAQGDTVNLAAGLKNNAGPGVILASENLCKLARDFFEFEPTGGMEFKAKDPVKVHRLVKSTGVETRFAASAAVRGLTRFVGRVSEIKALNKAFERAGSGEGRVVGISGEAGVGKSRLLLEFRKSLPKDRSRYFEGRCFHYGGSMPYLPLLDVLRSFIGAKEGEPEPIIRQKLAKRILGLDGKLRNIIPPLQGLLSLEVEDKEYAKLDPKQKMEKTFEAIRDLLVRVSKVRPLVLAIEDLHWIDRTTEEFLDHMIGWLPEARILLILLYRNEYSHHWGGKPCYSEIALSQLSVTRSAELVAAILEGGDIAPELTTLIFGKSGGNPFFVEELTFSMVENGSIKRTGESFFLAGDVSRLEIPDTIQGVIAGRMDRLEESPKRIMQVAAVIGGEFAFRILETISEAKRGLKSELVNLQRLEFILRKSLFTELEYIFRHALTREVAYNSLLVQKRKEIHEQIGGAIEELYPQRLEEFYEMLAWHYSHSNNLVKACQYLKLSGQKAVRGNSHREAFRLYKEALEVLHQMPRTAGKEQEQLEVLRALAISMRPSGYPEGSIDLLLEGEALAKETGDDKALANFLSNIGAYYWMRGGDPVLGKTYIEKGLGASELIGEVDIIAPVVLDYAISCMFSGDWWKICEVAPRCLELIESTRTQSEDFGRHYTPYPVLKAMLGVSMGHLGNFDMGEDILRDCRECIRTHQISNPYTLARVEFDHGLFYRSKGDGKKAVEHFTAAIGMCEKNRFDMLVGYAWFCRRWIPSAGAAGKSHRSPGKGT
jgi:class 3 adenylate cyclase